VNIAIQQAIVLTAPRWRDKSRAKGIQIQVETHLARLPSFLGHAPEVREILTNLIFNAVDAMPEGGFLRFTTLSEDGCIVIRVSDTGVGMTEEECSRCLEPFYTTKGDRGTGLGLAAVYGFVQRYGGSVAVQSRKWDGTTFTLTLPSTTVKNVPVQDSGNASVPSLRVLVVDDQEIIRQIIVEMLQAEGHQAVPVESAQEVLRQLALSKWDLVISDQSMPGMTGAQLAAEMRERGSKVPLIVLTGFGDEMRTKGGTPQGADLLLSKPVTASALKKAIATVVEH
jgi:CheY-like chemotaxis protein